MTQINATHLNKITQGDSIEEIRKLADKSVDLIVIDPPYNIGKDKRWDKWKTVDAYVEFMTEIIKECERVLKPTGSFYCFHNDMGQVRKLMDSIDNNTTFEFKNFIVWNKRYTGSPRKYYFDNVIKTESSRCFRPLTEYCLFYTFQDETGLKATQNDQTLYKPIRDYFMRERKKTGLTYKELNTLMGVASNGGGMASNILTSYKKGWTFPTKDKYTLLQKTGICQKPYEELRKEYESLRIAYESKREEYEDLRYTYNNLKTHHDVWEYEVAPKLGHVTPKPVEMIENIILHSSNEGDVVLDCFLGSGTTAVAAINTGRQYIGIEREPDYVAIAQRRIDETLA